jgi:hypothetical protein
MIGLNVVMIFMYCDYTDHAETIKILENIMITILYCFSVCMSIILIFSTAFDIFSSKWLKRQNIFKKF